MKKRAILVVSLLLCCTIVGCGKKDDKQVVFEDESVKLVNDVPDASQIDMNIDDTTTPQTSVLEESLQSPQDYELLDKAAYDALIASLPKSESGVLDFAKFSPEQQAMYDKFQNGVYVTSFSAEDVYKDFVDFFSERNLGNIHNVKYIEGINKTRGNYAEDKENYKNYIYSAVVEENNSVKHIDANCSYRVGKKVVNFKYDYMLSYDGDYYYGYKTQPKGTFYHVDKTIDFKSPLQEISELISAGAITNFSIDNIDSDVYTCSFEVDPAAFNKTTMINRAFIEEIFEPDECTQVNGQVWVNYATNRIDSVVFVQTLGEKDNNMISVSLDEYNNEKFAKTLAEIETFDKAKLMGDYLTAKRDEYSSRPDRELEEDQNVEPTPEPEDPDKDDTTSAEQQAADLWSGLDIPPEGTTALLDGNGKRIKDTTGHTIFVYKDTFIPYDPTQIPEGMETPIGTEPVIGALLKPADVPQTAPAE